PPTIELQYTGSMIIAEGEPFQMELFVTDFDMVEIMPSVEATVSPSIEFDFVREGDWAMFSWTPGYDVAGAGQSTAFTVTFTATDEFSAQTVETLQLIVLNTNREPSIEPIEPVTVTEGKQLVIPVDASDPDGDPLMLHVEPMPATATTDGLVFTWKTTQADVGEHVLMFSVWDREVFLRPSREANMPMYASTEVFVTVIDTNYAPVLQAIGDVQLNPGDKLELFARATDPDGDAITFSDNSALFDIDPETGAISYTAVAGDAGTHLITITATDSKSASHSQTFYLSIIADTTPPVYVSMPIVTSTTTTSATIEWTTNEPSTSVVTYGLITGPRNQTASDPALVTNHRVTITGLNPGVTYGFGTRSADAAGNLSVERTGSFTTRQLPPPPLTFSATGPFVSNRGAQTATIEWETNRTATSVVQYGTVSATLNQTATGASGATHSVLLSGLTAQTTYYYRAVSVDAGGESIQSDVRSFTTKALVVAPVIISGPTVIARTHETVTLQWDTDRPATSIVQYGPTSAYGLRVERDLGDAVVSRH
ncbi:MAG TPA: hypothetical protein ENN56_02145, partial [Firmicutes bacterium]|nr:hypothetical protein [Bacillota bacterium]